MRKKIIIGTIFIVETILLCLIAYLLGNGLHNLIFNEKDNQVTIYCSGVNGEYCNEANGSFDDFKQELKQCESCEMVVIDNEHYHYIVKGKRG